MSDDDRKAILRRRTFFVTSALAAIGSCARTAPPATQPEQLVVVPSAEPDAGEVTAEAPPAPERDASNLDDMPPTDMPSNPGEIAKRNYETLYRVMKASHAHLTDIEMTLPSCNILDQACDAKFAAIAAKLVEIDEELFGMRACGGTSAEAKAYREREAAHRKYLTDRRKRVEDEIERLAAKGGNGATERWVLLKKQAQAANPQPCLRYACPDW
jgi:hypothetical protein